jgi:hypothetical protein
MSKKTEPNEQPDYRQGDLVFLRTRVLPDGLCPSPRGNIVAEGELSDHKHVLDTDRQVVYENAATDHTIVILKETTLLIHSGPGDEPAFDKATAKQKDTHIAVEIPPGKYVVVRERILTANEARPKAAKD